MIDKVDGALWTPSGLEAARVDEVPDLDRIVVAIDPPVTGRVGSDECGIVVAGAITKGPVQDWRAYVLADGSIGEASPMTWASAAIKAMEQFGANRLVAEVNQGGDMVAEVIRNVDPLVPVKTVHATRGKCARAEPVAALYEQGRVKHVRGLGELEDQMCAMSVKGYEGAGSPDRVDALVWALTELMIEPAAQWRNAARPSGAIVFSGADGQGTLSHDQYDRLVNEMESHHQGARNAGRPMLLEGGLDWKPMGFSPSDMEFQKTKESAAREIALAFGVPPMLLGIPGDATYANYQEANRAFYRLTVLPLVARVAASVADWLSKHSDDALELRPDLDLVPALSAERDAQWARVTAATFLSDDEKRALLGLAPQETSA